MHIGLKKKKKNRHKQTDRHRQKDTHRRNIVNFRVLWHKLSARILIVFKHGLNGLNLSGALLTGVRIFTQKSVT